MLCILNKRKKPVKGNDSELTKLMNNKVESGTLKSIRYSNSGDMNGNLYTIELDIDNKKLIVRDAKYHNDPIKATEYIVSDEDIKFLVDYVNKYNFPAWKDIKRSDLIAYDAPTKVLTLTYEPYKAYSIYYDIEVEDETGKVLREFTSKYLELPKNSKLEREYIEEKDN